MRMLSTLFLSTIFVLNLGGTHGLRVCTKIIDYYIPFSNNCHDNPVYDLNITEIIQSYGFVAEEYYVTTEDGFELLLIRAYDEIKSDTPVIAGHGLFSNGISMADRGNKSYVYNFVREGYEFWLINFRGTKYTKNKLYKSTDAAFWDFTLHELGYYDLRASIDFIYRRTHRKSLYIGYSMGSAAGFIYSIKFPSEAQTKLVGMLTLAPVAYLSDVKSLLIRFGGIFLPAIKPLVFITNHGELLQQPGIIKYLCAAAPSQFFFCTFIQSLVVGFDFNEMDPADLPIVNSLDIDSASIQLLAHLRQLMDTNAFAQYDHGLVENLIYYGQDFPPLYNASRISIPVSFFLGNNDYLTTIDDATRFYWDLNEKQRCRFSVVKHKRWNHLDFIIAKDIIPDVINPVLETAAVMINGNCGKYQERKQDLSYYN